MACLLTKGRGLPCKTGVGGIKAVFFVDYGGLGALTTSAGEVSGFGGSPTLMKFDVKGNSTLDTTVTSSRENGTTFYESSLVLNLTFQEKETSEEIKLLAVSRPQIIVADYNGNFFLIGEKNGAELTSGSFSGGAAMGDLFGYSLTFATTEQDPPLFVQKTVMDGATEGTQITPN
jgi:hypothetical protein|tara:strand:+ start:59 stop:583 length:525 start_codon:yes stop_codon:yes gene_type:complete